MKYLYFAIKCGIFFEGTMTMATMDISVLVLFSAVLLLLISTGIILIGKGVRRKLYHVCLLGISYLIIAMIFLVVESSRLWLAINALVLIGNIFVLIFIQRTFFLDRKSPFRKVLIIVLALGFTSLVLNLGFNEGWWEENLTFRLIYLCFLIPHSSISFLWYGRTCQLAQHRLESSEVESWVILRLRLLKWSAYIMAFIQWPTLLALDPNAPYADVTNFLSILEFVLQVAIVTIFSTVQFLAWIMPQKVEGLFNRSLSQETEQNADLSEEEVNQMLGGRLS